MYDAAGHHLGRASREVVHELGLWHRVFHLLVVSATAEGPAAILQRRAAGKLAFPGLFDLTATGHILAGEEPLDALRELHEELGVSLDPSSLVPVGVRRIEDRSAEGWNREHCHLYVARDDRPLEAYTPNPEEVDAVAALPLRSGLDLLHGVVESAAVRLVSLDAVRAEPAVLARGDLVPEPVSGGDSSSHWITALTAASNLAGPGERGA